MRLQNLCTKTLPCYVRLEKEEGKRFCIKNRMAYSTCQICTPSTKSNSDFRNCYCYRSRSYRYHCVCHVNDKIRFVFTFIVDRAWCLMLSTNKHQLKFHTIRYLGRIFFLSFSNHLHFKHWKS